MSSTSEISQEVCIKNKVYSRADISNWISSDKWPRPSWISDSNEKKGKQSYEDYFTTHLRSRLMEHEADFRTIVADYTNEDEYSDEDVGWILPTAAYALHLLNLARDTLSSNNLGKQQLIAASNLLDLIEECLVWIKPIETVPIQIVALKSRLRNSKISEESKKYYSDLLEEVQKKYDDFEIKRSNYDKEKEQSEKDSLLDFSHSIFEETTWICNDAEIDDIINIGLQINRLNKFYTYGWKLLPVFLFISPLLINIEFLGNGFITGAPNIFDNTTIYNIVYTKKLDYTLIACTYMASIATAFLGGCGGFLSGLLQVRDSKTSLDLYEESMILLKIRPFFGAFAALITFILISWNVFSEILTSNPSSLFLAAFLSGFSERYFLKLLKLEPNNQEKTSNEADASKIKKEKD